MATLSDLRKGIFSWFDDATGSLPIKWSNSNERMDLPYGVLQIIATRDLGNADKRFINNYADLEIVWHRIVTVSCDIYGLNSIELMLNAHASLNNPFILEDLEKYGLAYVNNSDIHDLTFFQRTDYIERAQMDVMFGFTYSVITPIDGIESVEIGGILTSAEIEGTLDNINIDMEIDKN